MPTGDLRKARTHGSTQACPFKPPSARNCHSLVVLWPSSEQSGLASVVASSPSKAFCSSPWGPAPAEATPESPWRGTPAVQLLGVKKGAPLGTLLERTLSSQKEGDLLKTEMLKAKLFPCLTFKYFQMAKWLRPCAVSSQAAGIGTLIILKVQSKAHAHSQQASHPNLLLQASFLLRHLPSDWKWLALGCPT